MRVYRVDWEELAKQDGTIPLFTELWVDDQEPANSLEGQRADTVSDGDDALPSSRNLARTLPRILAPRPDARLNAFPSGAVAASVLTAARRLVAPRAMVAAGPLAALGTCLLGASLNAWALTALCRPREGQPQKLLALEPPLRAREGLLCFHTEVTAPPSRAELAHASLYGATLGLVAHHVGPMYPMLGFLGALAVERLRRAEPG